MNDTIQHPWRSHLEDTPPQQPVLTLTLPLIKKPQPKRHSFATVHTLAPRPSFDYYSFSSFLTNSSFKVFTKVHISLFPLRGISTRTKQSR